MDYYFWLKTIVTIVLAYLSTNWLITFVLFPLKRDLSDVALLEQASVSTVRKDNETAHYRNFLIPSNFPLITGLNLALGYKFRNGNFADVWSAIMDNANKNFITFSDDSNRKYSLKEINSLSKSILENFLSKHDYNQIGISISVNKIEGFVISLATMMGTIRNGNGIPHFLSSVPRQKIDGLDVLVIGSWKEFQLLNSSLSWYKLIIVCDSKDKKPINFKIDTLVLCWDDLIQDCKYDDSKFDYNSPEDKSDDFKSFAYFTSPQNETTCFAQMTLVSSVASFFKAFPINEDITQDDELSVVGSFTKPSLSIQMWNKVFSVLLVGGSVSFINKYDLESHQPTMLFINSDDIRPLLSEAKSYTNSNLYRKSKMSWSTTLLSEGILTRIAQLSSKPISNSLDRLRSIFLAEIHTNSHKASSLTTSIPKMKQGSRSTFTTSQLNEIRALFGARVVYELYFPYFIMGPIAATNYYDYRILPNSVETKVSFHGALCTSIEAKFVNTENNSDLDVAARQGMLCIRGFTIGKPVDNARLEKAIELSENIGNGEGWMPMVGIFGLFGHDGCLYLYN